MNELEEKEFSGLHDKYIMICKEFNISEQENVELKKRIKELHDTIRVIIDWVNKQNFPNKFELSKKIETWIY
jgi:hypothetical protein